MSCKAGRLLVTTAVFFSQTARCCWKGK